MISGIISSDDDGADENDGRQNGCHGQGQF